MKRKFSKILGVGLTLALLASLLMTAAPVSADVGEARVSLDDDEISATAEYTITFGVTEELLYLVATGTRTFTVTDGDYTTTRVDDDNGEIEATLVGSWTAGPDVIGDYIATGTGLLYATGHVGEVGYGSTADVIASGTLSELEVTMSGTVVQTADDPITDDDVTDISGTFTINADGSYVADLIGDVGGNSVDLDITGTIAGNPVVIEFDEDFDIDTITGVTIGASSGIGVEALAAKAAGLYTVDGQVLSVAPHGDNSVGIGAGATVQVVVSGVKNADDTGDYYLEISTSAEPDAVTSEPFTLEVPEIEGLPGVVTVYNPSGIPMDSFTGEGAVEDAILEADDKDWVIKFGPGTYGAVDSFDTDVAGVTFKAVGDVTWEGVAKIDMDDIVIEGITFDGDGGTTAVIVAGVDVSFEDCAFEDADVLLEIDGDGATIEDCTFTLEDGVGIDVTYAATDDTTPPEITDCTFTVEEDGTGVGIEIDDDTGVTDCTFTGGSGVGIEVNGGESVIEDSAFDGLDTVLDIDGGTLDFSGNTIENCTDVAVDVAGADKVLIHNNTITGSDDAAILDVADGAAASVSMLFNDITDNAGDEDLLVNNGEDGVNLYVINNWWGDADGPSQGDDAFSADVVAEPFLTAPVSDSVIDAGTDDFDAEDECGVTVTSEAEGEPVNMDIVGAAKYAENPGAAIDDTVGFWDVCMIGDAVDEVTIRFYTDVTEDTEVYVWGAARGEWLQCDPLIAVPNLFSGFIAVTVGAATTPNLDDLAGLPFAIVEPPAGVELDDAPELLVPAAGADDVSLTPTFAWEAVADADGYYFQLADNASFVTPMVKLDGDVGRLPVTAYAYVTELPYSTAYYWRVKAVSGTIVAGDLMESDWVSSVFITKAEPEEPIPPIVIEPYEPPEIIIEQPDIVVPLPAETPITPTWIYVIIAVGAVLVIALIVLIVRTRRVA